LVDAAELIEECGWTQGTYHDEDGFCIHGAINAVTKHDKYQRRKAKKELRKLIPGGSIIDWNDAPGCTKSQALTV
jgi:hypothetical protein